MTGPGFWWLLAGAGGLAALVLTARSVGIDPRRMLVETVLALAVVLLRRRGRDRP